MHNFVLFFPFSFSFLLTWTLSEKVCNPSCNFSRLYTRASPYLNVEGVTSRLVQRNVHNFSIKKDGHLSGRTKTSVLIASKNIPLPAFSKDECSSLVNVSIISTQSPRYLGSNKKTYTEIQGKALKTNWHNIVQKFRPHNYQDMFDPVYTYAIKHISERCTIFNVMYQYLSQICLLFSTGRCAQHVLHILNSRWWCATYMLVS
jgi:hypothetical protein